MNKLLASGAMAVSVLASTTAVAAEKTITLAVKTCIAPLVRIPSRRACKRWPA
jgi:hypothetical protein